MAWRPGRRSKRGVWRDADGLHGDGKRRVRTPEGAKLFGQPVGTVITADMIEQAKRGAQIAIEGRIRMGATDRRRGQRAAFGANAARNVKSLSRGEKAVLGIDPGNRNKIDENLPQGHRYHADPVKERAARYQEAIVRAQGDKDVLAAIKAKAHGDPQLSTEHKNKITELVEGGTVLGETTYKTKTTSKPGWVDPTPAKVKPQRPGRPDATPDEKPDTRAEDERRAKNRQVMDEQVDNALSDGVVDVARMAKLQDIIEDLHDQGKISDKDHKELTRKITSARRTRRKDSVWSGYKDSDFLASANEFEEALAQDKKLSAQEKNKAFVITTQVRDAVKDGFLTEKQGNDILDRFKKFGVDYNKFKPVVFKVDPKFVKQFADEDFGSTDPKTQKSLLQPKRLDPDRYQEYLATLDVDNTPAAQHLSQGGGLMDAPADGLAQYVDAHPERFEKKVLSGGLSGSEVYNVLDKDTGQASVFKRSANGGSGGQFGDDVAEVLAASIGTAALPDLYVKADYAESPEQGGAALIRVENVKTLAAAKGIDVVMMDSTGLDPKNLADRSQLVGMVLGDFLMNNGDRHEGNVAVGIDQDGKQHLFPIDHGASFNSYTAFDQTQRTAKDQEWLEADGVDLNKVTGKVMMKDPETGEWKSTTAGKAYATFSENVEYGVINPAGVRWDEWLQTSAYDPARVALDDDGNIAVDGNKQERWWSRIEEAYDGDEEALKADIQKTLSAFKTVPMDQIKKSMMERFPNIDQSDLAHWSEGSRIFERRLASLEGVDIMEDLRMIREAQEVILLAAHKKKGKKK